MKDIVSIIDVNKTRPRAANLRLEITLQLPVRARQTDETPADSMQAVLLLFILLYVKMASSCCAVGCTNRGNNAKGISFHR